MAQMEYDTQSITDAVIARMTECQDPRFKQVMTVAHPAPARFRARGRPAGRRVVQGDRVPDRLRQDLRREAPGVHPPVRHAGRIDAGRRAGTCPCPERPQRRHAPDRRHGARPFLLGRRTRAAAGQRHRRRAWRASLRSTAAA